MTSYKRHRLDVYGSELYLARSAEEWKKLRKRVDCLPKEVPTAAGQTTRLLRKRAGLAGTGHVIVFWVDVAMTQDPGYLVNTCAHEATHGANFIFDWIGHDVDAQKDEPTAYLVGWLTEWLWTHSAKVGA